MICYFLKVVLKTMENGNNPICLEQKKSKHFTQVIRKTENTNLGESLRYICEKDPLESLH